MDPCWVVTENHVFEGKRTLRVFYSLVASGFSARKDLQKSHCEWQNMAITFLKMPLKIFKGRTGEYLSGGKQYIFFP